MKKIQIQNLSLKIIINFILISFFWGTILSSVASAASITVSGPSSVTESSAGGSGTLNGVPVTISDLVQVTLAGDTYVNELANSSIRVTYNVSGDCGLSGSKNGELTSTIPGAKFLDLHTSNDPESALIYVYPIYKPEYTGTRKCTLSFNHDAASSLNTEIASQYGGVKIASYTFSILDAQSKPTTSEPDNKQTSSTPNTVTSNPEVTASKPNLPTVKLIDSEGNELEKKEGEEKVTFDLGKPVVLTGTTVPNGEVKLYIFSEPQEATVTADQDGAWTYTIENLEAGNHRVEAEVTDPSTGETSERAEIIAFTVAQSDEADNSLQITSNSDQTSEDSSGIPIILIVVLIVLLLALSAGSYWFIKKKKNPLSKLAKSETSHSNGDEGVAETVGNSPIDNSKTNSNNTEQF